MRSVFSVFRLASLSAAIGSAASLDRAGRVVNTGPVRMRAYPLVAALLALLPAAPAEAEVAAALAERGWEEIIFEDYTPNRWLAIPGGVRVLSEGSVSIVFRPLAAELAATPVLRWRWRSEMAPLPADLTQSEGEDRALALYVGFPYQPERAGFWEQLKRLAMVAVQGEDAPGRLLTYVWGGDRPRGTLLRREDTGAVDAIAILRTPGDPVGVWLEERVDVAADFHAAFGWEAPDPTHIGIVSDSDDSGQAIDASIADIAYEAR